MLYSIIRISIISYYYQLVLLLGLLVLLEQQEGCSSTDMLPQRTARLKRLLKGESKQKLNNYFHTA